MATTEGSSTVQLLRKSLVLGHKLQNQSLVNWANAELNGYYGAQEVPKYREVSANAKANMSGPFGSGIRNMPIAPSFLKKDHRQFATHIELREPLANYEELMNSTETSFRFPWPQDLVIFYQDTLVTENGCILVEVWQVVGRTSFAQILDAVKNRTLGLCLELQGELGEADLPSQVTHEAAAQIQRTVTNNIYGGVNVIASDESNVTQPRMHLGDTSHSLALEKLRTTLTDGGMSKSDIAGLEIAFVEDGPVTFGGKTKEWIKNTGVKFAVGGVKLAGPVAQGIVTSLIKQHLGLQ